MKLQKTSDITQLVEIYKEMSEETLENEVNELSNLIYAILVATDSLSIDVMFDQKIQITMCLEELPQGMH
jgi:hypothetical protein